MLLKIRLNQKSIQEIHAHDRGRLLVITGARQTGKSTLARMAFPDYDVINLDSPVERALYERWAPAEWISRYPRAVIDEAQKLPAIFDTIKACYDRNPDVRYVLLGSSQILLMKGVRETLAGRAALRELFPFSLPELVAEPGIEPKESRLVRMLRAASPMRSFTDLFVADLSLRDETATAKRAWERLSASGGMPALHAEAWTDEDRREWLRDYQTTYLQRDLADLARLDRLEPFARAQKAAALRASQPVSFADLARLADVSPPTAKQFMQYLEVSYQVFWLPAWSRNAEKRLVKRPKLHFVDPGLRRVVAGASGEVTGAEFEGAVAAEVWKQVRTAKLELELTHLRTVDGREVDLLIEREDGYLALECKRTDHVHGADFKHLRGLEQLLDKPLLAGIVVSQEAEARTHDGIGDRFFSAPAWSLLG